MWKADTLHILAISVKFPLTEKRDQKSPQRWKIFIVHDASLHDAYKRDSENDLLGADIEDT